MASATVIDSPDLKQEPLRHWEKWGLGFLLLVVVGFGVLVEVRSAFSDSRKTDVGTYFRAGWAVRSGANMYEVTDDNWWHYCYPPAFAIFMTPLADAPRDENRDGMLPYPVSVAIWYAFSVLVVFLAVHWLASGIEESSSLPTRIGGRKWWYSRLLPFYICLAPIGCTLSRGQVNMMVVALAAGMFLATVRHQRFRSGLWLSAAICLKIYPAFLLIFPTWRRDSRALLGVGCGLLIGVAAIPTAVWGVNGAIEVNRQLVNAVVKPGLGLGGDSTRDKELIEITATDNQSIQAVIHNYRHWDRESRPTQAELGTKIAHVTLTMLLTGILLAAYGLRNQSDPLRALIFLGSLINIMAIASPVSHTHYFCLALPLVVGLAEYSMSSAPDRLLPFRWTLSILVLTGVCFALPMIPFSEARREIGLSLYGSMFLWVFAVVALRQRQASISAMIAKPIVLPKAA